MLISRRWIKIATVQPKFICTGNSGRPGFSVHFSGRNYVFRPIQILRWKEICDVMDITLALHRLRATALACDASKRGEIQLIAEGSVLI